MNELSLEKQARVKKMLTDYMGGLSAKGKKAKDAIQNVKTNEGLARQGMLPKSMMKGSKETRNAALKDLGVHAGKGLGVAAGGALTIAALAKGIKAMRGGKSSVLPLTKKEKLIKMMKKNPKATAAAGVGGGVGLAALLNK